MIKLKDGRTKLYQWDTGRTLTVPVDCSQIHYSNDVLECCSIDVPVTDGEAIIPDILLQTNRPLHVWAFTGTSENGYTKISKVFTVVRRNKPADYVFTPSEQTTLGEILERLDDLEQNSGGNVVLTAAQISALDGMFKVCSFASADVSAEYNAFKTAFNIGGTVEPDEPDTPVDPEEPEVTLSSISATYSGGDVTVGTAVTALTGIVVTAHYSDGSSQTVTGYALSGTIAEGSNTVTVSYGGKTTTFIVNGVAESGGDEVTIYEPEANIVVTTTLDIDNTLVVVDTGATSTNASWCASDYVAIPGGKDYLAIQPENTSTIRYALYDSEKVFIKGGILSSVTALAIEYPDNAAYIRLSTNNKTVIGTVTLSAGNTMVTNWGDPDNHGLKDNGNISTSATVHRISDGYVKIPVGAKTLFWGNKSGYSFVKVKGVVYDSGYSGVGNAGEDTTPIANLGNNFTVHNKIDLTVMDNVMYFKAQVNDASNANNNNPAEQYVIGYI